MMCFIINRFRELKKKWIIERKYPNIYPHGMLKSIVSDYVLKNSFGLFIEENVQIRNSNIHIGKHVYIGNNTIVDACKSIGAFSSIASDVKIGVRDHPLDYISTSPVFYSSYRNWLKESSFNDGVNRNVVIEEDVLISSNVIILNGVTIGRGAVIAAGAVVNKDVEPYCIVGGIPAKKIRMRFDKEVIEKIEKSIWWEKEDTKLKDLIKYAYNPISFINKLKEC
jgi:acetyltransferase-like isoleucine patch superfamily enzyme